MKRTRFSNEQITKILKEETLGFKITDICRKHGISEQTFYNWRKKFRGTDTKKAVSIRVLEKENKELKLLVAELSLDNHMLRGMLEKNSKRPKPREPRHSIHLHPAHSAKQGM